MPYAQIRVGSREFAARSFCFAILAILAMTAIMAIPLVRLVRG